MKQTAAHLQRFSGHPRPIEGKEMNRMQSRLRTLCGLFLLLAILPARGHAQPLDLSVAEYQDRVHAAWLGQIIGTLIGFQFEGRVASSQMVWIDQFTEGASPPTDQVRERKRAIVDDDWYYEIVALRAFEKYGVNMTLDQLGEQWKENSAGSWGSSEQTRLGLARGIKGSATGHPRNNRVWWTIGPQFSSDIYGLLAPGNPNLAGRLARTYGRINGHAEAVDGAVFVAGMISLAFRETNPRKIVREAAELIHPSSPYRQCLDLVISMAGKGKTVEEIFDAVEDRWHIEYPPMNNAVANGGLVAASVWFGEGDFLKTVNLAYRAADFSDADCNAANAAAVVGTMKGTMGIPKHLIDILGDRTQGDRMGGVILTPPVDESISEISRRTARIGQKMVAANRGSVSETRLTVPYEPVKTQESELFKLADLTQYWNPDWKLERAGFGGVPEDRRNVGRTYPQATYLEYDVLATWPRDQIRGLVLRSRVKLSDNPSLNVEVGADAGRAWQLSVFANNTNLLTKTIEGEGDPSSHERNWQSIPLDLSAFRGQDIEIRLYQRTLVRDKIPGNAYWRTITLE